MLDNISNGTKDFSRIRYTSVAKNDQVDLMVEKFVTTNDVKVPIHRVEEKKYLFGTKLISAKIINGKLMVRVGGGYMTIEQFVGKH